MSHDKVRIFVVDDEPIIASTLARILSMHGFLAHAFTDPRVALGRVLSERPELLLSDIVMPGMSGIELALQVRVLCPECKVLLFSGQATTVDFLNQTAAMGARFNILSKPIYPGDLLTAIRNVISDGQTNFRPVMA